MQKNAKSHRTATRNRQVPLKVRLFRTRRAGPRRNRSDRGDSECHFCFFFSVFIWPGEVFENLFEVFENCTEETSHVRDIFSPWRTNCLISSCSSNADEDEIDDPSNKAVREKERRQANNVRERYVKTGTRYLFLFFLNIDPSYIPSSQRLTYDWNKNDFSIVELLREQCLNREQQDREKTLSFRVLDIRLCTRTTLS